MVKSGFVAIVGRPSAGKSTLLNAVCGEKVAITSPVPQTTRNAIRGIVNRESGQIVFLDTPGYHESDKKLNIYLKDTVHRSLKDSDAVLYVVDASKPPGKEEAAVVELLAKSRKPVVVAMNKMDLPTPLLAEIRGLIKLNLNPAAIIEISAMNGSGTEEIINALLEQCPEGEPHYPEDYYTDQDPAFRIAEIIREQAIARSEEELPHALYVDIADMEFGNPESRMEVETDEKSKNSTAAFSSPPDDRTAAVKAENGGFGTPETAAPKPSEKTAPKMSSDADPTLPAGAPAGFFDDDSAEPAPRQKRQTLWVRAFIVVERSSQVGILVGHGGEKIKAIRIGALREMKRLFPWKIRLDLRVKVNPKWRKKDPLLKHMLGSAD